MTLIDTVNDNFAWNIAQMESKLSVCYHDHSIHKPLIKTTIKT